MFTGTQGLIPTTGIEEEYFVVDLKTLLPVEPHPDAVRILQSELRDRFTLEYKLCQIEGITAPHSNIDNLCEDIYATRYILNCILEPYGQAIMAVGMHPIANWKDMPARSGERYEWIQYRLGHRIHRLAVCGTHVHVGTFTDDDIRVRRMSEYKALVPMTLAAAACSPFDSGNNTGSKCARRDVTNTIANQVSPHFADAATWRADQRAQIDAGYIRSESDVWTDIRPGTFGKPTVELRSCDVSPSIDTGIAIAAVVQMFEFGLRTGQLTPNLEASESRFADHDRVTRETAKFGFDATIQGKVRMESLRKSAIATSRILEPFAKELGTLPWLATFQRIVCEGGAADKMLQIADIEPNAAGQVEREKLDRVARWLVEETARPPKCQWPPFALQHHLNPTEEFVS